MHFSLLRSLVAASAPLALTACAVLALPPTDVAAPLPLAWQSGAAPSGADSAARLRAWWQRWNDPLLLALLDSAQQASPTVAAAATRVAQARQAVVAAGAATSTAHRRHRTEALSRQTAPPSGMYPPTRGSRG